MGQKPIPSDATPGPTPDEMRATMKRYLEAVARNDVEAVVALFADSISVEDPVGGAKGTHVVGIQAVTAFFRKGFERSRPAPSRTGPIRTTGGREAAMPFSLRLDLGGRLHEVDVIDIMEFDSDGQIVSLRAFWNPNEMRALVSEPSEKN
jgi:steroid delta-isomerase